jgi:tRNA(Ile)-lysidine synthase
MRKGAKDRLSGFSRPLLAEWRRLKLPRWGARVIVAASGGADSTALVLALAELKGRGLIECELKVAHLDHGLRGVEGAEDARWIEELARGLGFEFETAQAEVAGRALATRDNLEQAARRERYEFLARAARESGAGLVVTGHTLDDQAETVLLALLRGSGADGLGGMRALRVLASGADESSEAGRELIDGESRPALTGDGGSRVLLARPLLGWARCAQTREYCAARGVVPREDAMNEDVRFARVRVRGELIPLLESFNPRAVEAVARASNLLRDDAEALEVEAAELLREATDEGARRRVFRSWERDEKGATDEGEARDESEELGASPLRVEVLIKAAAAVRRRALRRWLAVGRGDLRRVELAHVVALERLLEGERGGRVAELPGGGRVERRGRWIFFRAR